VKAVGSSVVIDGFQLYYALPKNFIRTTLWVNQITQIPGPYATYAEKFLNISEGVIQDEITYFEIEDANLERYSRPDSLQNYTINYLGFGNLPRLQLAENGLIKGCNLNYDVAYENKIPELQFVFNTEPEPINFFDMGVIPFVEEVKKTLYKTIQTDSTPQRVPFEEVNIESTSEEHNAKEAADFIRKLRKRKLKLLVGLKDETFAVDGNALQIMVNELEVLEQKYLELFIGKTVKKTLSYAIDFEPDADILVEQKVLGWFSQSSGFTQSKLDLRKSDFKPLTISASIVGKVPEVSVQDTDNSGKSPVAIKHGLYYRVPVTVNISLAYIDKVIVSQKMLIAQKGSVMALPVDYLNQPGYGIEFYPDLGSVKRIVNTSNP
jgi:hypothetical protein